MGRLSTTECTYLPTIRLHAVHPAHGSFIWRSVPCAEKWKGSSTAG